MRVGTHALPNPGDQIVNTGHSKRSTVVELATGAGTKKLRALLGGADVFSQSYRPRSLVARCFSAEEAAALRPGIIYVSLSAFAHVGPWRERRGFDTLVQAVNGIADEYALEGTRRLLSVSVLDYTTGYLAAYRVMVALTRWAQEGGIYHVRLSLAQTGRCLTGLGRVPAPELVQAAPENLPLERLQAR